MRIQVLYRHGCPNIALAVERVEAALTILGIDTNIEVTSVLPRVAFEGSPTVLVEGKDVCPSPLLIFAACRTYATPTGIEGAPSVEAIRSALARALAS
jgi:hypothetical protein